MRSWNYTLSITSKKLEARDPGELPNDARLLMEAAKLHLDRVTTLSNRQWNADVLFWGSILASGSALIGYALKPDSLLRTVIENQGGLIISAYYLSMLIYFFLMSVNKHQSLVTERNRYQACQDRAFQIVGLADYQMVLAKRKCTPDCGRASSDGHVHDPESFAKIKRTSVFNSVVWGAKLLSTLAMVVGVFVTSQVAADFANSHVADVEKRKLELALAMPLSENERLAAAQRMAKIESKAFTPSDTQFISAFFDHDKVSLWELKTGSIIALCGFMFYLYFGLRAFFFGNKRAER